MEVTVEEARTEFPRLLQRVEQGEEVLISREGEPVARFVPAAHRQERNLGIDRGVYEVPDDFDAPLPPSILTEFER